MYALIFLKHCYFSTLLYDTIIWFVTLLRQIAHVYACLCTLVYTSIIYTRKNGLLSSKAKQLSNSWRKVSFCVRIDLFIIWICNVKLYFRLSVRIHIWTYSNFGKIWILHARFVVFIIRTWNVHNVQMSSMHVLWQVRLFLSLLTIVFNYNQ